jgi:hypothetical protein
MAGDVAHEVAELRQAVDRLTQGLQLMLETQGTQTEMLRAVLAAMVQPTVQERELDTVLDRIAATLRDHSVRLEALLSVMKSLPSDVGTAVAASLGDVLAKL